MKDNTMKLLLVTPYFAPHSGGLENYAFNIAQGLMSIYGFEVVVITSEPHAKRQIVEEYCGIKIYRLPTMFLLGNTPINPLWYFAIKKIIRAEKPDIINSHQPVPFIGDITASLVGNIPFVLTYHAGTMRKDKFLLDNIIFFYEGFILPRTAKRATRIICSSNFVRNTILKRHASKCTVIHPGVDISVFRPAPLIKKKEKLILFICRYKNMHEAKGLYYLLDAIKLLPDITLRIIGEKGCLTDKRVVFAGLKQKNDLAEEMQRASVVVLPSLAHRESFGMVLIEAMACQTPVIGTERGGIPEVIEDDVDGFLVPAGDSEVLAEAISKILEDKELANRMGCSGEAKVRERFTWDTRVELTKEVFASCLE